MLVRGGIGIDSVRSWHAVNLADGLHEKSMGIFQHWSSSACHHIIMQTLCCRFNASIVGQLPQSFADEVSGG